MAFFLLSPGVKIVFLKKMFYQKDAPSHAGAQPRQEFSALTSMLCALRSACLP